MAAYDSPGFSSPMPGSSPVSHESGMTAAGSQGVSVADGAAPLASGLILSQPTQSGQTAPDFGRVSVGDTASMSNDQPVNGSPLLPDAAGASSTGAGAGSVTGPPHPNARSN